MDETPGDAGGKSAIPEGGILHAIQAAVTFTDEVTGREHTRILDLEVTESPLGISLTGEDFNGRQATIVFFSQLGMDRIRDVTGAGADAPEKEH